MGENNQLENQNYEPISWWDEYSSKTSCDYDQYEDQAEFDEEIEVLFSPEDSVEDQYSTKVAQLLRENLKKEELVLIKELFAGANCLNCQEVISAVKIIVLFIENHFEEMEVDVELMEHYPVKVILHHQQKSFILNHELIIKVL